jgi:hypothetical protein
MKFAAALKFLFVSVKRLPGANYVFKPFQVDTLSAELDAFHRQACSLFDCGFTAKFDLTPSAEHSVPWKMIWRISAQQSCNSAMVERIARRRRNLSIGADFSCRNRKNDATKCCVTQFVRTSPIA